MTIATVSSKGQITLPVTARREAGIDLHDRVIIEARKGEIVVRPVPDLMKFKGFLGKAMSREKERKAMALGIAEHLDKKT